MGVWRLSPWASWNRELLRKVDSKTTSTTMPMEALQIIHTDVLLTKSSFVLLRMHQTCSTWRFERLEPANIAPSISGPNIIDYVIRVAVMFRIFFPANDVWSRSVLQESLRRQGVNAFNAFLMKNTYKSIPLTFCNLRAERNHNIT